MFVMSNSMVFHVFSVVDDHETDFEYEGSDNEEEVVADGEPR